ncbi:MAG: hypothetical protein JO250_09140 [Armatimonadetes bacterium]|nr:hypothetical protein [Armatimonadota bacterium]
MGRLTGRGTLPPILALALGLLLASPAVAPASIINPIPRGSSTSPWLQWSTSANGGLGGFVAVPIPVASASALGLVQVGSGLSITSGGVLSTVNNGTVRKFATNIGAITAGTGVVIAHGLGTADLVWNVVDVNGKSVYPDVKVDATNVTLTFQNSYAANSFRLVVEG